jgi:hypothetical protein
VSILLFQTAGENAFFDGDFVREFLHHMVVGDTATVSEAHAASIFRVEVCRLISLSFCF